MQTREQSKKMLVEAQTSSGVFSPEIRRHVHAGLKYGHLVYRFRWFIIAFWTVMVVVSLPFAAQISSVLTGGGYSARISESTRAETLLREKAHQPATQLLVVFQSTQTLVSDPDPSLP